MAQFVIIILQNSKRDPSWCCLCGLEGSLPLLLWARVQDCSFVSFFTTLVMHTIRFYGFLNLFWFSFEIFSYLLWLNCLYNMLLRLLIHLLYIILTFVLKYKWIRLEYIELLPFVISLGVFGESVVQDLNKCAFSTQFTFFNVLKPCSRNIGNGVRERGAWNIILLNHGTKGVYLFRMFQSEMEHVPSVLGTMFPECCFGTRNIFQIIWDVITVVGSIHSFALFFSADLFISWSKSNPHGQNQKQPYPSPPVLLLPIFSPPRVRERCSAQHAWRPGGWRPGPGSSTMPPSAPPLPARRGGFRRWGREGSGRRRPEPYCGRRPAAGDDSERPSRSESAICELGLRRCGRRWRQVANRRWWRQTAWCREVCDVPDFMFPRYWIDVPHPC
jgi:hypothetical protein